MYVIRCLDGIGEFKIFEYYIELDPNMPRVQPSHKVISSVELRLKSKVQLKSKA